MELTVALCLAVIVGVIAKVWKNRSLILWTLSSAAVMIIGEIPLRFMILMTDPRMFRDPASAVPIMITVDGALFLLMMLIVCGFRKLPPEAE